MLLRAIVLISALIFFGQSFAADAPKRAWWLHTAAAPQCPSEEATWFWWDSKCINIITESDLANTSGFDANDMRATGAVANTSLAALGASSTTLYYSVATFKARDGRSGAALVIAEDPKYLRVRKVLFSSDVAFSTLILHKDRLIWAFCLYCNDFEDVTHATDRSTQ